MIWPRIHCRMANLSRTYLKGVKLSWQLASVFILPVKIPLARIFSVAFLVVLYILILSPFATLSFLVSQWVNSLRRNPTYPLRSLSEAVTDTYAGGWYFSVWMAYELCYLDEFSPSAVSVERYSKNFHPVACRSHVFCSRWERFCPTSGRWFCALFSMEFSKNGLQSSLLSLCSLFLPLYRQIICHNISLTTTVTFHFVLTFPWQELNRLKIFPVHPSCRIIAVALPPPIKG